MSQLIKVTTQKKIRSLVDSIVQRLDKDGSVSITGAGKATGKTVSVVEITKRKVPGLHQITSLEKAALPQSTTQKSQCSITITLSKNAPIKDGSSTQCLGYQAPISISDSVETNSSDAIQGDSCAVPSTDNQSETAPSDSRKRPQDTLTAQDEVVCLKRQKVCSQ
eukprot:306520_1